MILGGLFRRLFFFFLIEIFEISISLFKISVAFFRGCFSKISERFNITIPFYLFQSPSPSDNGFLFSTQHTFLSQTKSRSGAFFNI